ncbi:hypothetical protein MMC30_008666 [Trapelia coarctata]|nr:hypothetical protein [Trapelia coarctata]
MCKSQPSIESPPTNGNDKGGARCIVGIKEPKGSCSFSAPTGRQGIANETFQGSSYEALQAADDGTLPEQAVPVRRVRTSADREGDRRTCRLAGLAARRKSKEGNGDLAGVASGRQAASRIRDKGREESTVKIGRAFVSDSHGRDDLVLSPPAGSRQVRLCCCDFNLDGRVGSCSPDSNCPSEGGLKGWGLWVTLA